MHKPQTACSILLGIVLILTANACNRSADNKKARPPTLITVAKVAVQDLEIAQQSIGQIESDSAPFVASEIAGRVIALHADVGQRVARGQLLAELDAQDQHISRQGATAEVNRLQALVDSQERLVERYRQLVKQNFVSQTMLDTNESQLTALQQQLAGARAGLQNADRSVGKTRVVAPVSGRVEQRSVALGDYVPVGKAMFQIATTQALRVHLPFPETLAAQLHPGLIVRLVTPTAAKTVTGRIADLRPMISSDNRAIDVIVDVPNPGDWRPGASVQGVVVVGERKNALTVPEQSVVQRPAGEVVYAIKQNVAEQRVVQTGLRQNGTVEILSGVQADDIVAMDGAAFLSDKAAVTVKQDSATKPGTANAPAPNKATPENKP